MKLPVMPPVSPMLAKSVASIPPGASYEPKWDGFRSICFRDRDEVELGSRNERPMTRYFPELVAAITAELPDRCVIDGEIVIATDHGLDFEALQQRIHPADSRVRMLAERTPASFIAFVYGRSMTSASRRSLGHQVVRASRYALGADRRDARSPEWPLSLGTSSMVGIESIANTSSAFDQTDSAGDRRCTTGRSSELLNSDEYDSSAIARANARAWGVEVANNHWATVPLTDDEFRGAARNGFPVSLTGSRPVPASWFGDLSGRHVLCIACGGGQQTVLLAARGAIVTSLENSTQQLQRDVDTCAKFGLALTAVEGSMDDMHMLSASVFDMVVLGMGAQFVADIRPVFAHVRRVLTSDGVFIGAFVNPVCYVFDWAAQTAGRLEVRHKVPYSDLASLPEEERLTLFGRDAPLEFGHSLEQIIGGLSAEGLCVNGYLEEFNAREQMGLYFPSFFVLRAG